ncbi:hypothetical protein ONZ45_g12997 [Pleurotus djamor]|nr:hypothetical protein ONZ45_g12997 [Pleurotus djamor]
MGNETPTLPPRETTVLVIGGGPAGSYAATVLAREGINVTLLEATKFPRYHIGEGMLPSMRHYLDYIDCEKKFDQHGFMHKPGACFKLREDLRETFTDFNAFGPRMTTWNVIRSEADEILLDHAATQGVAVYQKTRVVEVEFDGDPANSRPISASWSNKAGDTGSIKFDYLIDASGRSGLLSTRYLKNREFREHLRNVAVWGYWRDVTVYQEGTPRSNAPWFEAMSDGLGWSWLIPLHDGTTSIGIVMHQDISDRKKRAYPEGTPSLKQHYLEQLEFLPGVKKLIGEKGYLVEGSMKASQDYSYSAPRYSGDHFRIIGDAANFVDPFFASGVHIAMTGGLSAATTICASLKGQIDESQCQAWHDSKPLNWMAFRFLFVVLGAYRQMRQQKQPILSDINEDNFDSAFALFRPVIAGMADASDKLDDGQVDKAMDFCAKIFDPEVAFDNIISVRKRYDKSYSDVFGPIMDHKTIEEITNGDTEGEKVMLKMNALKPARLEVNWDSV